MNQLVENERTKRLQHNYSDETALLIQEGGYISPDNHLWEDILVSVVLKKPVLLKGPSGSGKTRLAQSVSSYFGQPMHSINCSVDLDSESLLGFKTIIQKDGANNYRFRRRPSCTSNEKRTYFVY